jgi:hypothetical protein
MFSQQQDVAQRQRQQQLLGNDNPSILGAGQQLQLMPLQNQPPPGSFSFQAQFLQADNDTNNNIQRQQQQQKQHYLSRVPLESTGSANPQQLLLNPYLSAGAAGFEANSILSTSAGGYASALSGEQQQPHPHPQQQQHYHQMIPTLSTSAAVAAPAPPPPFYPVGNSAIEMFNTTACTFEPNNGRIGSRNVSMSTSACDNNKNNNDPTNIRQANLDPVPALSRKYGRTEPMADDVEGEAALSDFQVYARQQIEFFEAVEVDVTMGARGRNNPIRLGQGKMITLGTC